MSVAASSRRSLRLTPTRPACKLCPTGLRTALSGAGTPGIAVSGGIDSRTLAAAAAGIRPTMPRAGAEAAAGRHAALQRPTTRLQAREPQREADFKCRMAVAPASGNTSCGLLKATPPLVLQATGVGRMSRRDGPAARIEAVREDHRQILEAIRTRDAVGAGLSMSTHRVHARRCVTDHARRCLTVPARAARDADRRATRARDAPGRRQQAATAGRADRSLTRARSLPVPRPR